MIEIIDPVSFDFEVDEVMEPTEQEPNFDYYDVD